MDGLTDILTSCLQHNRPTGVPITPWRPKPYPHIGDMVLGCYFALHIVVKEQEKPTTESPSETVIVG